MKAVVRDGAMTWGIAMAVSVVCSFVAVHWFRVPEGPLRQLREKPKAVKFTRVATNEAALLDKTALFLPTKWNASQKEVKMPDANGSLSPYAARFAFSDSELKLENLPVAVVTPANAPEALAIPLSGTLFNGLGRSDAVIDPLSKRGAHVEVVAASSGRRFLAEPLLKANPPGSGSWQALEFLASIDSAGLVSLDLTTRSGVEEVDVYFSRFLEQNLRIGARLPAGSYRISVGP